MWVMTSVETLGYYRPSLRDEEGQILAALNTNVPAPVVVPSCALFIASRTLDNARRQSLVS